MARCRKVVLPPGTYHSPDGMVVASKDRIASWVSANQEMRKSGIRTPLPWGHQSAAVPGNPDESAYLASRYNAGYVELEQDPKSGALVAVIDAAGLSLDPSGMLVDPATGTAIGEVSAGIAKEFRDGKGRIWHDVITHVAITTLPVWAGQDGFAALALKAAPPAKVVRLSLATASGWRLAAGGSAVAVPTTPAKKKPFEADVPGGDEPKTESAAKAEPEPEEPAADVQGVAEPETPAGMQQPPGRTLDADLGILAQHGITLPQDTTPENAWERLIVAVTALQGQLTPAGEDDGSQNAGVDPQTKVPREEPRDMMLSLRRHADPLVRQMAEQLVKVAEEKTAAAQADFGKRCDALIRRGAMPHAVKDLKAQGSTVRLSLAPGAAPPRPVEVLEWVEKLLPGESKLVQQLSNGSGRVTEVVRPDSARVEPDQEIIDRLTTRGPRHATNGSVNGKK